MQTDLHLYCAFLLYGPFKALCNLPHSLSPMHIHTLTAEALTYSSGLIQCFPTKRPLLYSYSTVQPFTYTVTQMEQLSAMIWGSVTR